MPEFTINVDEHLHSMLEQADRDTIISCLEEVSKKGVDAEAKRDELRRKMRGDSTEELTREFESLDEVYSALDSNEITESRAKQEELKLKRDKGGTARKGL